ncbi:serine hydrolase domain-containing protein [Pseudooceanicola sp. MF1-13]|uniref:serine hydrolase domain-containing protein n=1 Tax=Pseudooceanicola sp. MF1-13 TaxID=3379095 RepID=UPI003891F6FF
MWRLVLILTVAATVTQAQAPADRVADFRTALELWVNDAGVTRAALALRYDNEPVETVTIGMEADQPVDLASLSKAITGVCISALVDQNRITYDTEARQVLNLPQAARVTIGALLSHATGLEKDHTQGPMLAWKGDPTPRWPQITEAALDPDRLTDGTPKYHYSNENYAVLGSVIEAVTGQPYDAACRERVLARAGVKGDPSDLFAGYLPWGGWAMSVGDYAQFVDYAFGAGGILTDRLAQLPRQQIDGPVYYGMGMTQRDFRDGQNVWHFGALCFNDGPNLGSYAVRFVNGWTLTAWYDACVTWPQMIELDGALAGIAFAGE